MKIKLSKDAEIEVPNNATVHVSEDGKQIEIGLPEKAVTEKIRVVEIPGSERIIERIKFISGPERIIYIEKPFPLQHHYLTYPTYPYWYNTSPNITYTTCGTTIVGQAHTIFNG